MGSVRVAIIGVGNCASSLVQGIQFYKHAREDAFIPGLMHPLKRFVSNMKDAIAYFGFRRVFLDSRKATRATQ